MKKSLAGGTIRGARAGASVSPPRSGGVSRSASPARSVSPPRRNNLRIASATASGGNAAAFRKSISDEEDVERVADLLVSNAMCEGQSGLPTHLSTESGTSPTEKARSISAFLSDIEDDDWRQRVDNVLPNFRDISVSSCCGRIKPRLLFRSARPFGDYHAVADVMVQFLRITTILDLRDDNLLALREEHESRLQVSSIFQPTHVSQRINRLAAAPLDPVAAGLLRTRTALERNLRDAYQHSRVEQLSQKGVPSALAAEVVGDSKLEPVYEYSMRPENRRSLLVVNVLDAPAVKRRVLQHATERANLPFLPVVVAARAIDKITGVNNLAPYYFCRFVVSSHELVSTYFEMVDNCGANFSVALKLIALADGPVLFHCTLGKDRTGVLAMLLLHILGATEQAIIFDYSLTEQASVGYQQYSRRFIVDMSGLPESFCRAGADIMRLTIDHVKDTYGSIDSYLDSIGVTEEWREFLVAKYTLSS